MRRFEFKEGASSKFWEVAVEGKDLTVRFGKIGTNGQTQSKSCAWDKSQKGKNLPLEGWKLPLYVGEHGALARNVPLRPHHELFQAAWDRVQSGDVPKFEEV